MSDTKVITQKVRFSYANVFEPKTIMGGTDEKYSVSILIDKDDKKTLKAIKKAIEAALEDGKTKLGKNPKNLKLPLRDGDDEREQAIRQAVIKRWKWGDHKTCRDHHSS